MLGKKEEGDRWGERKEQEKDGSEAVLSHVYFCPPGPGSQDGRGDPPEDVTWGGGHCCIPCPLLRATLPLLHVWHCQPLEAFSMSPSSDDS